MVLAEVKELVSNKSDLEVDAFNKDGHSAAMLCVRRRWLDVLKVLSCHWRDTHHHRDMNVADRLLPTASDCSMFGTQHRAWCSMFGTQHRA